MTDKELLELAAKAAGYDWIYSRAMKTTTEWMMRDTIFIQWDPLKNNADAFCLAVKLRMSVHVDNSMTDVTNPIGEDCTEAHLGDPYAATRRAIVRAAAETGKTL